MPEWFIGEQQSHLNFISLLDRLVKRLTKLKSTKRETKKGSMIGHRIDYNVVEALRGQ